MSIFEALQKATVEALQELFDQPFTDSEFQVNITRPEFTGDYTVVLFSLLKKTGLSPDKLGNQLGEKLVQRNPDLFTGYNIIKGFLNLEISDNYWISNLEQNYDNNCYGRHPVNGKKVMIEYSSPNTNKPLHLGHLRNNFLGWSVAEILKANGYEVYKSCIVNDRGIHICKSMVAWQDFANGATPASTGIKGDHFVGDYYVKCEDQIKKEAEDIMAKLAAGNYDDFQGKDLKKLNELEELKRSVTGTTDKDKEQLKKIGDDIKDVVRANTPVMKKAKQMLVDWEAGKPEVIDLWKKMNEWVYEGFDITYNRTGTDFDKKYYESNIYLLGKDIVQKGLDQGVFYKKEDGSVWIDLRDEGLDEKIVIRSDGTSVYITQDIGLAVQKYEQYGIDESIYVIADEQNYHMKVLKLICQKLELPFADNIHHLSYGMVELPSGRMKSREGTVVDADDLVEEMVSTARKHTEELGKVKDFNEEELASLYETLGIGAMKFYLLRVDPKKKMVFNPEESIEFHGFTGPFIQYTHARIRSVLRKEPLPEGAPAYKGSLLKPEKDVLTLAEQYPAIILQAAREHNPSVVANYLFLLAKTFNSFYTELSIASAESEEKKFLRLRMSVITANIIRNGMKLLGINVPERM